MTHRQQQRSVCFDIHTLYRKLPSLPPWHFPKVTRTHTLSCRDLLATVVRTGRSTMVGRLNAEVAEGQLDN